LRNQIKGVLQTCEGKIGVSFLCFSGHNLYELGFSHLQMAIMIPPKVLPSVIGCGAGMLGMPRHCLFKGLRSLWEAAQGNRE
jgi:hypothetical protein